MNETCYSLLDRLGSESQRKFLLSMMDGAFDVFELDRAQIPHIAALREARDPDVWALAAE